MHLEGLSTSNPSNPDQTALASRSINSLLSKHTHALIPDVYVGGSVHVVSKKNLQVDFRELAKEFMKDRLGV